MITPKMSMERIPTGKFLGLTIWALHGMWSRTKNKNSEFRNSINLTIIKVEIFTQHDIFDDIPMSPVT